MEVSGRAFIEAMGQKAANALIYEDNVEYAERIPGLHVRFNDLGAGNGGQIINAGGADDSANTSIWLITWGQDTTHLIYPRGCKAGIKTTPVDGWFATDDDGNKYAIKRMEYEWHLGLVVRDWRYVARVANIPRIVKKGSIGDSGADRTDFSGADLCDLMEDAYYRHEGRRVSTGNTVFYCNPSVHKILRAQLKNLPQNAFLTWDKLNSNDTQKTLFFNGIPVREMDQLHYNEDPIT